MPMAKTLVFLQPAAAATVAAQATMSPREGMKSILTELVVVVVFLFTWTLTKYLLGKKRPDGAKDPELAMSPVKPFRKVKRERSADEQAATIVALCADQFTRGLRLYREMVKYGQDKQVTGDAFFMSMVEASVRVGKPDVAEQVLERMRQNGMQPTHAFIESVMKLFAARKMHAECVMAWTKFGAGLAPHQVILSCVAVAACEVDEVVLARELLECLRLNFPVQSREWLALCRYHVRHCSWQAAIKDMEALMALGMPIDNIVFNTVLAACVAGGDEAVRGMPQRIQQMLAYQARCPAGEPTVDVVSYNTLLKAHARGGDVQACFALLEQALAAGIEPDDVSFSTLLDVCIDEDEHQLASVALERMSKHGVQMNCIVMTTLMKGFVRSRRLDKAMQLYESMRAAASPVKPDMITHSMLIKAHCDAHDMGTALRVLEDMLEAGCAVDDVVFTHLIEGCCQVGNVRLAEKLFKDMRAAKIAPSVYTLNGLVKIYGKSRESQPQAVELIKTMEAEFGIKPTVVVFTCLSSGQIRTKNYAEAWATFQWMRETIAPDLHNYHTMILGLTDGQMWQELVQLAPLYAAAASQQRGKRVGTGTECLNHALAVATSRGQAAVARKIRSIMAEHDIEVTVPQHRLPK